jgi:DNA-directed RNA polymerase subunit M/transcription elongation factor TFIIS
MVKEKVCPKCGQVMTKDAQDGDKCDQCKLKEKDEEAAAILMMLLALEEDGENLFA